MRVFLIAVWVLFALPAFAEEWVRIGTSRGFPSYLKSDSLRRIDNNTFHFWMKMVTPEGVEDKIGDVQTDYSLQNFAINCSSRMITTQRIIIYGKNGNRLDDFNPMETKPIEPDSFAEAFADLMCPTIPQH